MTNKIRHGTLSTKGSSDKKNVSQASKDANVTAKMKELLGRNLVRIHPHANDRMGTRGVIYFEVLQALSNARHEPRRDRFSETHSSWEYSFNGSTIDDRELRIGVAFEVDQKSKERLLVVTVIDLEKDD